MKTYTSKMHENLARTGSVLNYVAIPSPMSIELDDIINKVGCADYGTDAKKVVANTQAEIVAEVVSRITGKAVTFGSASIQRPTLFSHDNMNHSASIIIASVDTAHLPSLEEAKNHYTQFNFMQILLSGAEYLYTQKPKTVPLLTTENIHTPFSEWGSELIGVYLATIMTCEKSGNLLDDDVELSELIAVDLKNRLNLK